MPTRWSFTWLLALGLVLAQAALFYGCDAKPKSPSTDAQPQTAESGSTPETVGPFTLDWDPATGRGSVTQAQANGDRYVLCLQCRFKGYTGGLWIGNLSGSGFEYFPAKPLRGFKRLNIFCAQDESVVIDGEEWANGWSENIGKGPDGKRFEYKSGDILEHSAKRVVLKSINAGGCIEQTRYLLWSADTDYIVIAAHFKNICDRNLTFDFWTGDDPWIGRYKTSEGDIGWTPSGFVSSEQRLDGWDLQAIGMVDLGNPLLGEKSAPYSGVADALSLPPEQEPPSRVYIANHFAHNDSDITPGKALDNKSMTAFNLGWLSRKLAPGQSWRIAYALGRAANDNPDTPPTPPSVTANDWQFDRRYHPNSQPGLPLHFVGERIRLTYDPPFLTVDGDYVFTNRGSGSLSVTLHYPFPIAADHPYPDLIEVSGTEFAKSGDGIRLKLRLTPYETQRIHIRYRQEFRGRSAHYILKTTAYWKRSLEWGLYEANWPERLGDVEVSLDDLTTRHENGRTIVTTRRMAFMPEDDFVLTLPGEK